MGRKAKVVAEAVVESTEVVAEVTETVEATEVVEATETVSEPVVEPVVETKPTKTVEKTDGDSDVTVTVTLDDLKKDEYKSIGVRSPGVWRIRKIGTRVYTEHQSC